MSIANEDWQDVEKAVKKVAVSKNYDTIDVQTLPVFLTINYSAADLNVLVQLQTTFFSPGLAETPASPALRPRADDVCVLWIPSAR